MKYMIKDTIAYFAEGEIFNNKQEGIERLAEFHNINYTGVKDDGKDTPYDDIFEFLATLKDDEARLDWLLDYGCWEIEEIGIECDRCGTHTAKWSGTPEFRVCKNCFQELQNDGSIN